MKKLSYLFGLAALLLPYLAGATTHDPALLRVRHEQPLTQRMVTTSVSETEIGETAVLQFFPDVAFTTTVFKISHETDSALIRYNDDARGASGLSVTTSDGTRLTIRDNQKQRLYQKVSLADGRFEYREYDLTAAPISTPLPPRPAPPSNELLSLPSSTPLSLNDQPIALAGEETTIIDVMVVYDTTAQAWVAGNGGMQAFAADTIERMNLALEASGIDARFRLVTAIGKNYTYTSSSGLDGALDAICDNVGVFMDIESLRTTYGADVVSLLVDTGSAYGFTGLSFEMMDKRGHPRYAYNTCSIQAVNQGHTLTHETGHILGCGHALNQKGSPGPGIYPYSCGYYFTVGLQKYHTIMGYSNDGYGNTYAASDYFSTPLKTYGASGVPVGTVNNDNARTFRENMGVISAYRAAKPAYTVTLDANGGSGGSVSVEAFVGQSMPVASAPVLSGYRFLGYWDTPMGSGGIQYYDSQMSSVRIWNKNSNATLYAWWVDANIEHYNISATVNPPASGVIYGTGLKEPAETCVALAAANTGYIFSNWTENGEIVSTTAGYTFTVLGDRELTANFTPVKVLSVNPTVRTVGKTASTTTFKISNTGNNTFGAA